MITKNYFVFTFLCLTAQVSLTMNEQPQETTRLMSSSDTTEQWTPWNYGSNFPNNIHTHDFKTKDGKIFCRTHKMTIQASLSSCIISCAVSPFTPLHWALIGAATLSLDQVAGCISRSHKEHVELHELDLVTGQQRLIQTDAQHFSSGLSCCNKQAQEKRTIVYRPHRLHPQFQTVQPVHIQNEERE